MDQFSTDPLSDLAGDDPALQRSGSRDSLLLSARLRIENLPEIAVRIRNLSSGGLMAEYSQPIVNGTPVEVEVRGLGWIAGRVAWKAEGRVGIAFEREIDPMAARKPITANLRKPTPKPLRRAV